MGGIVMKRWFPTDEEIESLWALVHDRMWYYYGNYQGFKDLLFRMLLHKDDDFILGFIPKTDRELAMHAFIWGSGIFKKVPEISRLVENLLRSTGREFCSCEIPAFEPPLARALERGGFLFHKALRKTYLGGTITQTAKRYIKEAKNG